jgi:hypothetical protein
MKGTVTDRATSLISVPAMLRGIPKAIVATAKKAVRRALQGKAQHRHETVALREAELAPVHAARLI